MSTAEVEPLDEQLVAAVQRGCPESFGVLYRRHAERVRRLLRVRTRDVELAEDLTHETFLRALTGIDGFVGGNVEAWLSRIAGNLVKDHFRLSRVRREWLSDDLAELSEVAVGPEVAVIEREERRAAERRVRAALADLTRPQRTCLVLRFYREHSVVTTARMMSRSEGAVKVLQHRAVRSLRQTLEESAP